VHPKTGKVCVPIDPAGAWEFDPDAVPTVQQLCSELQEAAAAQQAAAGAAGVAAPAAPPSTTAEGWRGTALEPHIAAFSERFLAPLSASSKAALNERAKQAAADQRSGGGAQQMAW
jgi:DNA primase small subunit